MARNTHPRLTTIAIVLLAVVPALFFASTAGRFTGRAYADPSDPPVPTKSSVPPETDDPFAPHKSAVPPGSGPVFPLAQPSKPDPNLPIALQLGRPIVFDQMFFMMFGEDLFLRLLRGGVQLTPEQARNFKFGVKDAMGGEGGGRTAADTSGADGVSGAIEGPEHGSPGARRRDGGCRTSRRAGAIANKGLGP